METAPTPATGPRRRIVMYYNGDHAPYLVKIWPSCVPHIKWLLDYISERTITGGEVWQFSYHREDSRIEVFLHESAAKKPHAFCHRLHVAAQSAQFDTVRSDRLCDLSQMLRENGIS